MESFRRYTCVWLILSLQVSTVKMGTVQTIYIKDNKPAIKGGDVQVVCEVSQFENADIVNVYKTNSIPPEYLPEVPITVYCNPSLCFGSAERHTVSTDSSKVSITVTNLKRSEDQKWWTCAIKGQRQQLHLTVYTITQTLQYDNPPSQDQDLAQTSVTLKCSTGCAYPSPSFTWYYNESEGSRQEWSTSESVTEKADGCTDSERIYTSTLTLARYTVFSSNADKTVKFQCAAMSITGMTDQLFTSLSVNVRFAVRVTSVTLKDGNTTPSSTLAVTSGVSKTLTCTTSASRPTATIIWYIGTEEKKRSTASTSTLTFTPDNSDHGKQVYCKAFNTQSENKAVSSNKPSLDVKVRVTRVTLKDGNTTPSSTLAVTSGVSKTLTCTTSASRPTATIIWYIGTEEKKRSTASTSTLTFTPDNSDHGKPVYCKAFNTQSENQAVTSNKPSLDVKVRVTSVTLKDGNTTPSSTLAVTSGVSKTLTCTTSASRPTATIIWFIGSEEKKRSTISTSSLTFTPDNSDHGKQVYCKAFNMQSENQAVSSNKPSLDVKVLATTPTITKQTGDKLEGDQVNFECTSSLTRPVATVTWKLDSLILTNVRNTANDHTGNLKSVTSIVTFTANRTDNNKMVYCETVVPGQSNKPKAQEKITVYWPPSTPSVPTTTFPFLEGQTGKYIYCYSTEYGNPEATATWNRKYGTPDLGDSRKLNFPELTYQFNGSPVHCQLQNQYTQQKGLQILSQRVQLQVEYSPIVQVLDGNQLIQTITKNEGQTLSVVCNASGNPVPTVRWVGQQPSGINLEFNDIDRTDDGKYTCRAAATSTKYPNHNFVREKDITVKVNYATDVTVELSTETPLTENMPLRIICKPEGKPENYQYISFLQKWGSVEIPNTHRPRNGVIEIQSLQLQDSGTYICTANNGVPDRKEQLNQRGNSTVKIQVSPKVLAEELRFSSSTGRTIRIQIPIYSYPTLEKVTVTRYDGFVISSDKYNIREYEVRAIFYGKPVSLNGNIIDLKITDLTEEDFGNYIFKLTNRLNTTYVEASVIAEEGPSPPKAFHILSGYSIPTFVWEENLNGGPDQGFVIQTSVAGTGLWRSHTIIKENDKEYQINSTFYMASVTGLPPGTYIARIFANNTIGESEYVYLGTTFDVLGKQDSPNTEQSSSTVPVAAGVSSAVIVVVAVVVAAVGILIWRKRIRKGQNGQEITKSIAGDQTTAENLVYDLPSTQSQPSTQVPYENLQGVRETNFSQTYESLQMTNTEQSAYASLTAPAKTANTDSGTVYENLRLKK